jgi:crossover junction endodeoxyribonuclease RuvC
VTILGIDPGLGCTGWGVIRHSKGNFTYIDSGRIRTKPAAEIETRIGLIFRELQRVIRLHLVELVAVESGYVGKGPQSALKLGQARAAAILAAETLDLPVINRAPREVKVALTGNGAAAKAQVAYLVGKMLSLEFEHGEDDISDALAVAICAATRGLDKKTLVAR